MKTFVDLFSGIGGLRMGFKNLKCVLSSEIDEKCKITYELNFKEIPLGDIKAINKVPKHDILLAGFPCQSFSIAGYRKGLRDDRGNLFYEILRVLRQSKPKAFLIENVKGLVSENNGKTFELILNSLKEIGYYAHSKVLNTMNYGNIPQTRERIYIVGFTKNVDFKFPKEIELKKSIKDLLLKEKQDEKYYYNNFSIYNILKKEIKKQNSIYQWRRKYVRENKSNVCPTLTANMGTGGHNVPLIKDSYGIRKLTPRECARFQGFPDYFKFPNISDCHLYKQIGNSVSIPVIRRIASNMIQCLN